MSNIVSLNVDKHSHLKVQASLRHSNSIKQHLMPLVPSEFGRASTYFPIIVTKNEETGRFMFSAMLGFQPGENLFVREGQWDADYEPLQIQRQPFFVGDDGDSKLLCFDSESIVLNSGEGEPLFSSTSEPSKYLQTVQHILSELMSGESASLVLLETLVEFELLTPFSLDIEFNDKSKQTGQGAYMIDERKMLELDDETLLQLYRSGVIRHIHNLQNSMHQLPNLIARKNRMLDTAKSWFGSA